LNENAKKHAHQMVSDPLLDLKRRKKQAWRQVFSGLENPQDPLRLFENAAAVVREKRFIRVPHVMDHLFALSRYQHLGRARWDEEMKFSFALDRMLVHFFKRPFSEIQAIIDLEAMARTTAKIPQQAVLLTFHGSFPSLLQVVFRHLYAEGFIVHDRGADRRREMLFSAMRALLDKQAVYIAPDSGFGARIRYCKVCQATVPFATGAAFLAYETRSYTGFYHLTRTSAGFAPNVIHGPRCFDGESYESYEARLLDFYAASIEQVLTGDPRDVGLRGRWCAYLENEIPHTEPV